MELEIMYDQLGESAEYIRTKTKATPKVGIVLGSGLGDFTKKIQNPIEIPYGDIPYFHSCNVAGHQGRLIIGQVNDVTIAVLQGRIHAYEGFPMEEIVFPTRTLATLGIQSLMLTNAAGGINKNFTPGDLVMIEDHINLMGKNPLLGPNLTELGPRFPDMTEAYHPELKKILKQSAHEIHFKLKSGVYAAMLGPTYETPAEVKMAGILGADMVGMSTVPESIAANHLGLKVCGISCITNMAAGIDPGKLSHDDIKVQAAKAMGPFSKLLELFIEKAGPV